MWQAESSRDTVQRWKKLSGPILGHILGPALGNDGQVLGPVLTLAKFLVMVLALKIQSSINV